MSETYLLALEMIYAPVIENTANRNSLEPLTSYRICYEMNNRHGGVIIQACSPFRALKMFEKMYPVIYENCLIAEIV